MSFFCANAPSAHCFTKIKEVQLCSPAPRTPRFQTAQNTGEKKRKIEPLSGRVAKSVICLRQHIASYLSLLDTSAICRPSIWYTSQPGNPTAMNVRVPNSRIPFGFECLASVMYQSQTHRLKPHKACCWRRLQVYGWRIRQSCFAFPKSRAWFWAQILRSNCAQRGSDPCAATAGWCHKRQTFLARKGRRLVNRMWTCWVGTPAVKHVI